MLVKIASSRVGFISELFNASKFTEEESELATGASVFALSWIAVPSTAILTGLVSTALPVCVWAPTELSVLLLISGLAEDKATGVLVPSSAELDEVLATSIGEDWEFSFDNEIALSIADASVATFKAGVDDLSILLKVLCVDGIRRATLQLEVLSIDTSGKINVKLIIDVLILIKVVI